MKNILLIGAGKSSEVLITYLEKLCQEENWHLRIVSREFGKVELHDSPFLDRVQSDVFKEERLDLWIESSSLVISMLPARLHDDIAKKCLVYHKHFLTASYVSDKMKALDKEVKAKKLLFLNECGLDPGLDHMSAMKVIDEIKRKGGLIKGFESFAGGLIAPDSDDNPWSYKLTWNPRNVVLAGQGGVAKFKQEKTYKYIPYSQLFKRTERMQIKGYGNFEGYANRDSLKYEALYALEGIDTIFRGTLRREGFCKAWDKLILLGMTEDSYEIEVSQGMTFRDFTNLFLNYHPSNSVEVKFQKTLGLAQDDFDLLEKMEYLGLFSNKEIKIKVGTPAQILQNLLEEKWKLHEGDRDMIVMWHKFNYFLNGKHNEVHSSLVVEGETQTRTAMAKTVGLPLGIAAKLILKQEIKSVGVLIPTNEEVYRPILKELSEKFGIVFNESKVK